MKSIITAYKTLALAMLFIGIAACEEDNTIKDETYSSEQFRVLKVAEGENTIENQEGGISAYNLSLSVTLSHETSTAELESNLSISGGASYTITLDETNTIATLLFDPLEYETEYTMTLTKGTYGDGKTLADDYALTFTTRPFIIPEITLSAESLSPEEGGTATVTANLSVETTEEVVVNLNFGGNAILGEDYSTSAEMITIPLGETSGSVELTLIDDEIPEGTETIEVGIESITNGTEEEEQLLVLSLIDNDVFTDLELKGILAIRWSTEPGGNSGKAVHLRAKADIPDLSVYAIGVANNGGGTDSIEFRFPQIAVAAGEDVLLAREPESIAAYFGDCAAEIEHIIQTDEMNQNGDDPIELYSGTAVIETYGDVNVDGTGQPWEYSGSWAYKLGGTWKYGGVDCAASSTSTQNSECIYPLCAEPLFFKGAMEIDTDAGLRIRAYHFEAYQEIADLSIYRVEIFNNGNPPPAFSIVSFPAQSAQEGEDILIVRDADAGDVGTYFGTCANRFTIYESPDLTSNGDDALVFFKNTTALDTLGVVGVDGTGQTWDYTNAFGYKEVAGADFEFPGADCTNSATSNSDAVCFYPFCE